MDDERFEHMLKMSAVWIDSLLNTTHDELLEVYREEGGGYLRNSHNCNQILAETCLELMRRLGVKPKFTVTARMQGYGECHEPRLF